MATPAEKLARSLEALAVHLDAGRHAIRSRDLSRTHRERLLAAGFLQEVMKGWYIPSQPGLTGGESTSWYVSFWGFCADYLAGRFGEDWCLSPEQSLQWHAGNRTVPAQLMARSRRGDNSPVALPFATSLLVVRTPPPAGADTVVEEGLRLYSPAAALIAVGPDFFTRHEVDARAVLARIRDASEILPPLLERGQTTVAGRLAGAFANAGQLRLADDIVQAMRAAGHEVRSSDPFAEAAPAPWRPEPATAHVQRLRLLWARLRGPAIAAFGAAPLRSLDAAGYLASIDESFTNDAYHSLSIEGYQVSRDLVERIRDGSADLDRDHRNALAARGYWEAFQEVRRSVERVLAGENPGLVVEQDHAGWYRALIAPEVAAGLRRPAELAGYRRGPVRIRNSRHIPPRAEALGDLLPAFFDLLTAESDPAARVVLGHFVFVYIHPYADGNGRIGRFLMNTMLAAGGWPWLVVPVERRDAYMAALERASVEGEIGELAGFLAGLLRS